MLRVLGIDPGSRYLGFGIVEVGRPGRGQARGAPAYVGHGVVCTDADQPLALRLRQLHEALTDVVATFRPDVVAVEGVFTHKNARSALILGHARGVALLIAAQSGLTVHEYAPARVKKSVGVGGNDSKEAVARMVTVLLKLRAPLERADAYDALAVALCHAQALALPRVRSGRAAAGWADLSRRLSPGYVRPRPSASGELA